MSGAIASRLLDIGGTDPADVWNWYQFQRQLLDEEAVRARTRTSDVGQARYFGRTAEEIEALFAEHRKELDFLTMLGMLAAAEGRLQADFDHRVEQRLKDPVSRRFRDARKRSQRRGRRIDLETDILDVWRDDGPQPAAKNAVAHFKAALRLRHWLAHGRHWTAKLGRDYDVQDVRAICVNLLQALGM